MKDEVTVMNFSHVYEDYGFMHTPSFRWIDCTSLTGTDCYLAPETQSGLERLISEYRTEGLHWIDSGNYHYMTRLWTDKIAQPFDLLLIDHHPDMQRPLFDSLLSCGSWVRSMLECNERLRNVCIIGMSADLLSECTGFGERVSIITEDDIKDSCIPDISPDIPVYISLDKDAFSTTETVTNWDQGSMTFIQLKQYMSAIPKSAIIGMDICGEDPSIQSGSNRAEDRAKNEIFNEMLYSYIATTLTIHTIR